MKHFSRAALLAALALAACRQSSSRLDKVTSQAGATAPGQNAAEAPALKIDRSGSVEQQLARLQDAYDRNAEAMAFLNQAYAQQKAQERDVPAEDAMFAVDITPDVKLGQVEGPSTAPITIVEAWDFG